MVRTVFVLAAVFSAAGCSLLVSTDNLAGGPVSGLDGSSPSPSLEAGQEGGADAATVNATCPFPQGVATNAAWPIENGCISRNGRSTVVGPASSAKSRSFRIQVPDPKAERALFGSVTLGGDGTIYTGIQDDDFGVRAFDATGTVKWRGTTQNANSVTLAATGAIYTNSAEGVARLDPMTGAQIWRTAVSAEVDTSIAIAKNGDLYYGTYDTGKLGALNKDGVLLWEMLVGGPDARMFPVALGSGDTLYVTSSNGELIALDPSGKVLWRYKTDSAVGHGPSVAEDGTIYAGGDAKLHAVNPNGTRKWTVGLASGGCTTPAIAVNGTIYVATDSGVLTSLTPEGGHRWEVSFAASISGQPVIDAEGTVFVATEEPKVHALHADGTAGWSADLPDIPAEGLALGATGSLVVTLAKGEVRIFDR